MLSKRELQERAVSGWAVLLCRQVWQTGESLALLPVEYAELGVQGLS